MYFEEKDLLFWACVLVIVSFVAGMLFGGSGR